MLSLNRYIPMNVESDQLSCAIYWNNVIILEIIIWNQIPAIQLRKILKQFRRQIQRWKRKNYKIFQGDYKIDPIIILNFEMFENCQAVGVLHV